jgi:hypothetical protein
MPIEAHAQNVTSPSKTRRLKHKHQKFKKKSRIKKTQIRHENDSWSDAYLAHLGDLMQSVDQEGAQQLAKITKDSAPFRKSHGRCFHWVRRALQQWLVKYHHNRIEEQPNFNALECDPKQPQRSFRPIGSAEDFKNWARKNPYTMCTELGLADISKSQPNSTMNEGNILVFGKGSCRFSRRSGHIEVVTNASKKEVCSDFCRIVTRECQPDLILIPVKNCDWLKNNHSVITSA